MSQIKLAIIIVSYKNIEIAIDCINSVYRYNDIGSQLEVILVDNSPDHNVYNAVMDKFSSVIGIKNKNTGFGSGNNLGATKATGSYLLFLNPDTILVEPVFEFAIKKFEQHPKLSMFGLKLISEKMTRNMSFYLINGGGAISSMITKLCNALDIYVDGMMYVSGANMFVRHEDFIQCGQFDEKIFMYYEEADLTRRLRMQGKSTAYFKDKRIIHLEGGTSSDGELALRRRLDSAIYYNLKHSKNPKTIFARELRLNYIKLVIYRLTGMGEINQINLNINILLEYLRRPDVNF